MEGFNSLQEEIAYLAQFINEDRLSRIDDVLSSRTRNITIVLEDIHKTHNANAILRTCDGFGVQDVHIIENKNRFESSSTSSLGSHKWLTLHKYSTYESNVSQCFRSLKNKGYTILATSPHHGNAPISEVPIDQKTALVFGTELNGVSREVVQLADGLVNIPMFGFVESYNLSASAAICLHSLRTKLMHQPKSEWQLSQHECLELKKDWMIKSIQQGERIWLRYLKTKGG
ncbi:MAG: rRNA methyltransferase [Balneola sp.]|nr:rRNA methyltransferase [Balneola sp.]